MPLRFLPTTGPVWVWLAASRMFSRGSLNFSRSRPAISSASSREKPMMSAVISTRGWSCSC